jgi:regulator of cell morphogenesis and NO signaling
MAATTHYKETQYPAFFAQMKMADLIHANSQNLEVLHRLGIPLGFGEKTVEEVCSKYSVDLELLLLICNMLLNNDLVPDKDQIERCPILQVVSFLQQSHQYYLQVALPKIHHLLDALTATCSDAHGKALNRFFDEYWHEVEKHLAHEEQIVYPYIQQLLNQPKKTKFTIQQFKDKHANIEIKLTDLKNIIIKYIPDDNSDRLREELLLQLFTFEDDLNRHTLIEEKLLVPGVLLLEKMHF